MTHSTDGDFGLFGDKTILSTTVVDRTQTHRHIVLYLDR